MHCQSRMTAALSKLRWRPCPLSERMLKILLIAVLLTAFSTRSNAEWQNSLKPQGEPAKMPLPLVVDGKPAAGILCPEDATPNDKQAALELQKWIKEITGAILPIYLGG